MKKTANFLVYLKKCITFSGNSKYYSIPLLGVMLGASFVFFMKRDMPERLQKALLGFASGTHR